MKLIFPQVRSEFDELLLRHAASCGVRVVEETRVTEVHFSSSDKNQPVAASWKNTSGEQGRVEFDYLVDASGRNGVMSTRYLNNRKFNKSLNNVACWGYWENTGAYMPGTTRENAVYIEALEGNPQSVSISAPAHGRYRRVRMVLVYSPARWNDVCWCCDRPRY